MKIWGIKNCNSVKKALGFLDSKCVQYEFIDYKKTPPSLETIHSWVEKAGIKKVLNTKGITYKKLDLKDKALSLDEQIILMSENPTLIKRPILEKDGVLLFGFDEAEYEKNL